MCQNYYDDSKSDREKVAATGDAATSKKENIFAVDVFIIS